MTLDVRDRTRLMGLSVVVILLFILVFLIIPGRTKIATLEKNIAVNEKNISTMLALEEELKGLRKQGVSVSTGNMGSFQVLSFLDQLATEKGIQDQIVSMRVLTAAPEGMNQDGISGDVVEVKLKGIQLQPLADFLFEIEHSQNSLKINKLNIRRQNTEPSVLDVVILVADYGVQGN